MPTLGNELLIAQIVADHSVWAVGRSFGTPVLNDDGSGESLFDIRFDDSSPPVALEVTSVVDGGFWATANSAERYVDQLAAVASEGQHGAWTIHIESGVHVRSLLEPLAAIIRTGVAPDRDDTPEGVVSVYLVPDDPVSVRIGTIGGGGVDQGLRGFSEDLAQAVEENADKLAAAVGYERHLAVDRIAMLASDPGRTPPPTLPDVIDYLWVIRRSVTAGRKVPVIWLAPDPLGWKLNGQPWE